MQWRIFEVQQEPGFRLSGVDLVFLVVLGGLAWGLGRVAPETSLWALPIYLGGSFFQFCNVFRIGNRLEAIWYVPFVLIAGYGLATNDLEHFWWLVVVVLEPLKGGLVGYRVLRGPYRGIGYRWVGHSRSEAGKTSGQTKSG